jgi:hypothetical protein
MSIGTRGVGSLTRGAWASLRSDRRALRGFDGPDDGLGAVPTSLGFDD